MNLNIGCGEREFENCVNVDKRKTELSDIQHDLEIFPWPFQNSYYEKVYAYDIIEHLTDVIKTMEEIHRILKPGGIVEIRTSAWDKEQSFCDPTHKHWFTLESFNFFDPTTWQCKKYSFYTKARFKVVKAAYDFSELVFTLSKVIQVTDLMEDSKNLLLKFSDQERKDYARGV